MKLNFSNNDYKNKAIKTISNSIKDIRSLSRENAFIILIHGISFENLENLCSSVADKLNITIKDAYNIIQHPNNNIKHIIIESAYELLKNNKHMGEKYTVDNKFNLSSWISHSLYEAQASENIASMLSINSEFAFCYGLLHDYGRKFSHNFDHVIIGFEQLSDLNLCKYAKGCLTHSFINGERYCNNEYIDNGFEVKNGKVLLNNKYKKEDIYEVLQSSNYNLYDDILNIADLMATDSGIVSPEKRVSDIAKRRNNIESSKNRCYFIASLSNLLLKILNIYGTKLNIEYMDIGNNNLEEIKDKFIIISNLFYNEYNRFLANQKENNEKRIQL